MRPYDNPLLLGYLLLFVVVGAGFILVHLIAGRFFRPVRPDADKLTIYECGEPTIGSAWIQFDLRFYVVALLFVIFDVEVAFFFPWAVVFGKTNQLANEDLTVEQRAQLTAELAPSYPPLAETPSKKTEKVITPSVAQQLGWLAFIDIAIFFGVLLVGFAYLWKRGDLDWVRSTAAEKAAAAGAEPAPARPDDELLVGAGY